LNRQKVIAAALVLPLLGFVLFQTPWVTLFSPNVLIGGVPLQVVYIFAAWLCLIGAAVWLGRALEREGAPVGDDDDLDEDASA